jgi:hypothetical protein
VAGGWGGGENCKQSDLTYSIQTVRIINTSRSMFRTHYKIAILSPVLTFEPITNFFMKFSSEIIPLKSTTTPSRHFNHYKITCSNSWGECKTCTSQCGTVKYCKLEDLQCTNNFQRDQFCDKPKIRKWRADEYYNSYFVLC